MGKLFFSIASNKKHNLIMVYQHLIIFSLIFHYNSLSTILFFHDNTPPTTHLPRCPHHLIAPSICIFIGISSSKFCTGIFSMGKSISRYKICEILHSNFSIFILGFVKFSRLIIHSWVCCIVFIFNLYHVGPSPLQHKLQI